MLMVRRVGSCIRLGVLLPAIALAGRVETVLDGAGWRLDGTPVRVPHTWNAEDAADYRPDNLPRNLIPGYFEGDSLVGFGYLRTLKTYSRDLPNPKPSRRYFLWFEGVSQKATVRVNGRLAARHVGAFTPFGCEITGLLRAEGNWLEVDADNRYDADVPPTHADYSLQGGLYRSVMLIETPLKGIDPCRPLRLWPDPETGKVRAEIPVMGGPDETRTYTVPEHKLWSPEEPHLYPITVTVGEDSVTRKVGFKKVEHRADGFYLNGRKMFVKGVSRHQDVLGAGWAMAPEQEAADMQLIKAMGCNAVRLAHYPQSERIYALCDELGLMVWSEVPLVNILSLTENYLQNVLTAAREMVSWRGNHVCIAWWSLFNEVYHGGNAAPHSFEPIIHIVADEIRRIDPVHAFIAASNRPDKPELNLIPEALGLNFYPGWYGDATMKDAINYFFERNPRLKSAAVSEYGGGCSPFHHANPLPKWGSVVPSGPYHPEEYHVRIHHHSLRDMLQDKRIWGAFPWQMFDSPSDNRNEGDHGGINDKGLVCRDHTTRKDTFYFYQANWTRSPVLHVCSKRMCTTKERQLDVTVFSNLKDSVVLTVNGVKVAERPADEVCTVVFEKTALRYGANEIVVTCDGLRDVLTIRSEGGDPKTVQ